MILRDAAPADAAALTALENACFPGDAWSEGSLLSHLSTPLCLTCLMEDGGEVIGYASGRALPPEAEVYRVAVLPRARRRGIGLSLLGALELRFAGHGCDRFFLEVRASNAPATRLYESLGYEKVGVRRRYYRAPDEDAALYEKILGEEA